MVIGGVMSHKYSMEGLEIPRCSILDSKDGGRSQEHLQKDDCANLSLK